MIQVLTQIKRKGYLWKAFQKLNILTGAADLLKYLYKVFTGDLGKVVT